MVTKHQSDVSGYAATAVTIVLLVVGFGYALDDNRVVSSIYLAACAVTCVIRLVVYIIIYEVSQIIRTKQ